MKVEPQVEHRWLQRLVGEWTYEVDGQAVPGQPPTKCRGSESVRSLGGVWVIADGQGEMPDGGHATTLMTLGYDPRRGRYVGTWVGSMMTHLWSYDGSPDAAGTVLTLEAKGPSFTAERQTAKYRDAIEFKSDDHRTLTSRVLTADGTWHEFMTAHYRRSR